MENTVHIIGGGLAGSEAAWQLARAGVSVVLHEMRGVQGTDAHHTDALAELVCSNSFRSDDPEHNAVGLIHAEMRRMESLIMRCADGARVPAGSALAVDRDAFADAVTAAIAAEPLIELRRERVDGSRLGGVEVQQRLRGDFFGHRYSYLVVRSASLRSTSGRRYSIPSRAS